MEEEEKLRKLWELKINLNTEKKVRFFILTGKIGSRVGQAEDRSETKFF